MRNIFLILILCSSVNLFAGRKRMTYHIKSDTLNTKITHGFARIYGKVLDYNGTPISGALVSTIDNSRSTTTNKKGEYNFFISDSDSSLYMFKYNYDEVIIYNYDVKDRHEVEIEFYTYFREEMIHAEKPVIYLYNNGGEMDVSIKLNASGKLSFTYPDYNNGWDVKITPQGIQHNNQYYPYLFWEGEYEALSFTTSGDVLKGYFISTDTVTQFLEKTTEKLGLNSTEATDFITYWAPRIQEKNYALIQFLVDDEYDKIAQLEVSPKPTTMRRIFMVFHTDNDDVNMKSLPISTPTFPTFNREGFALIEWGGAELSTLKLNL